MIRDHISSGAKCTIGSIEVKRSKTKEFGVIAVDGHLKVQAFVEKPADPPVMHEKPGSSMGICVFDVDYFYGMLECGVKIDYTSHDFRKDIIPKALKDGVLYVRLFKRLCIGRNTEDGIYWRDEGAFDSY
ncbi:sugar phosphate nucleotidyltransferase [Neisseria iguanae]|uniref:sugar phosphate nucleotidyltransferase n=1 Tax=Neisseria iguanae TaxID=90242 RepID=UPI001B806419|nr:sugar phosphate nucleotidyltransferase [Neisseria iguanae]